jgi:hypothetical protein
VKTFCYQNYSKSDRCQWLTPVILATQEAEIRKISVLSQPRPIIRVTLSQKPLHKNRASGVTQHEDPEFKPQYHRKKKELVE